MSDWKYGTVLRNASDAAVVMVCAKGGGFTADDTSLIADDYWWGITLSTVTMGATAWGPEGGRTWICDGPGWNWEIVDE